MVVAINQGRLLNTARFNRIVGRLAAQLDVERPLNFLRMLPLVPAFDDELVGRFTGKIIAADLVADDQKALVQESMTLDVITHSAPNVKIGQRLGQKDLNRLDAWQNGLFRNVQGGDDALRDWEMQLAENLVLGVRERMNAMACGMLMDAFTYDRFGVKITNATWGMPAAFKVTVAIAWTNATTATPINDFFSLDASTRVQFGLVFDKITMSTADFLLMVATTEFANKATLTVGAAVPVLLTPAALAVQNVPAMLAIAGRILGKTIVLDDTTYWEKDAAGNMTQKRALPLGKVILSRVQDEGNGRTWDFGNGIVTESMLADIMGAGSLAVIGGGLPGKQFGPIGYYAPTDATLNPPGVVAFGVARCFPRKYLPEASAVLTVR